MAFPLGKLALPPWLLPGLPARAACLLAYTALLRPCAGGTHVALVLVALLLWLQWDAARTAARLRDAVRQELAAPLKVAEYAAGPAAGDPTKAEACTRFEGVRRRTHCAFASRAVVWGNDWQAAVGEPGADALALNVALCLPRLYRFCLEVRGGAALDGFVFEARGAEYSGDLASFAKTVRRLLAGLSARDPAGVDCMARGNVGRRGWFFQFAREPLFVTAFAPCYAPDHPRYQFGVHPDSCFVLLQPEESFLRHALPPDKPRSATNWDDPQDVRDRIRANFRRANREYLIPETTAYPPAEFIVSPLRPLSEPPVRFWLPKDDYKDD